MNDFKLVVDFYFSTITKFFNIILSNWLMSLLFLIMVFSLIINIFLLIKGNDH